MAWLRLASAFLLALAAIVFALWLWRRVARLGPLPVRRVLLVLVGGAGAALVASGVERWVLGFAELSLRADGQDEGLAPALAMILFCAPLEEALKAAAIWPLYASRRLVTGQIAATYAVIAAAGFAALENILSFVVWGHTEWLDILRSAFALPAHFFFAGLWGYMLGGSDRDRYFTAIWLACVGMHGMYDHIVFGRGPALLVIVVPMLAMMVGGVVALLRSPSAPSPRGAVPSLFEPPSVGAVRAVMARKGRPLMVQWIFGGAFVTLGVILVFLALAVYVGHRLGVDFALVDEAGVETMVPVALLGSALLAAFPFSAYLIARASGAVSVLEPAWATGASIVVVLALFSVTEPTALVIAMGVAPVGFALACIGAWFGLERS